MQKGTVKRKISYAPLATPIFDTIWEIFLHGFATQNTVCKRIQIKKEGESGDRIMCYHDRVEKEGSGEKPFPSCILR